MLFDEDIYSKLCLRFSTKKFALPEEVVNYFLPDNERYVSCWIFLFTLALRKISTRFNVQLKYVFHFGIIISLFYVISDLA